MKWTIHPLVCSELVIDLGRMTYLRNYGKSEWLPCPCFLLKSGRNRILVDTSGTAEDMGPLRSEPVRNVKSLETALREVDAELHEIKDVVVTHLMYDHCANGKLLPNTRFIVQKSEMDYAEDPHPLFAGAYHRGLYKDLNIEFVQGAVEVAPGVRTLFTPGHSRGCQSVLVDTEQGTVGIAGFCCIDENFTDAGGGAWVSSKAPVVIPPGIHLDVEQAYDSAVLLKEKSDRILTMHDKSLLNPDNAII